MHTGDRFDLAPGHSPFLASPFFRVASRLTEHLEATSLSIASRRATALVSNVFMQEIKEREREQLFPYYSKYSFEEKSSNPSCADLSFQGWSKLNSDNN